MVAQMLDQGSASMGMGRECGLVCQSSQLQCWLCHNEVAVLCRLGHHTRHILMTTGHSSVECGLPHTEV